MKKLVAVIVMVCCLGLVSMAQEVYRPVHLTPGTNKLTWVNGLADPVVLRGWMFCCGISNQSFTVDWLTSTNMATSAHATDVYTNRLLAATTIGPYTNSLPNEVWVVLGGGDSIVFTPSVVLTNQVAAPMNRAVLFFQKSQP